MYSYLFVLGNNQSLSIVEIINKLHPNNYCLINKDVFRIDFTEKIDAQKLINKIGGTIKIVELLTDDFEDLLLEVEKYLPEKFKGKYKFGFSFYGQQNKEIKKIAMDVKRELKSRGIACRWIVSRGNNLSSVVVDKNNLIENKSDFVIVENKENKYFGITRAIQDFNNLSKRDYQRPARDSYSGMIPPKLAQIMINIGLKGNNNKTLLDPFCGSGTILMEAYLMGVRKIFGTDLSEKAVKDSRANLRWVKNNLQSGQRGDVQASQQDVRELSRIFEEDSIDLIVTEPFLGPQKKSSDIKKAKKNLEQLYSEAIEEFKKILKDKGRVVMIWPVLRKVKDSFLNPNFDGFQIIDQIPKDLKLNKTKRNTIVYGRRGQRVWREIVVLEKN